VRPDELLLASSEQEEGEELEQLESELQTDLKVLFAKADKVSRKRTDYLDKKEGARLAEGVDGSRISGGTWMMPMILED
jgi:hypothetical protein